MHSFQSKIEIIGVNPFVFVPTEILAAIFIEAGRDKGPIPVHGHINNLPFTQTLVRYAGEWRLYINSKMLKNSPKRIGDNINISLAFDPKDRTIPMHPKLAEALDKDTRTRQVFESLSPSRQHEINRYITSLKSDVKIDENVARAIDFLHGKGRFAGRGKL